MEVKIEKAQAEDRDDVIDLANYVFSHNRGVTDFPATLPKLYKPEHFMDNTHYIIREGGRIKASLGAYPLKLEFKSGDVLPGRGIGMVSVHPYCRSRGYMSKLVTKAINDMKQDGIVFSCLSGDRQRYEYFGFTPTGSCYAFTCYERNVLHSLGVKWNSNLSLKLVCPDDDKLLDEIYAIHEAKIARIHRRRDRFFDIISSWRSKVYAVTEGDRFIGYFICRDLRNGERVIIEINLFDYSRLSEVIGLFMRANPKEPIRINANLHEGEKLSALFHFAETHSIVPAYHFAVLDYGKFIEPLLKLASNIKPLTEGSFSFRVGGSTRVCLEVSGGKALVNTDKTGENNNTSELCLSDLQAQYFLFSPMAEAVFPVIRENNFLRNVLPLPLFYENTDGI